MCVCIVWQDFRHADKKRLVLASGITEGHKVKSAMYTNLKL